MAGNDPSDIFKPPGGGSGLEGQKGMRDRYEVDGSSKDMVLMER